MEVTEVKVKVVPRTGNRKLKAFATVTFDDAFVVKDIRLIQGLKGTIIAMPTKKLTFRCYRCGHKNPLRARFCNECGHRIRAENIRHNPQTGRPVLQVDIAHPIQPETRKKIEEKILEAYQREFDRIREDIAAQIGEPVGGQELRDEIEEPEAADSRAGETPEAAPVEEAEASPAPASPEPSGTPSDPQSRDGPRPASQPESPTN